MERTKKVKEDNTVKLNEQIALLGEKIETLGTIITRREIHWQNVGGGTLRYVRGKMIKPGEKFKAYPDEVPLSFRDVIIPLESISNSNRPEPKEIVEIQYKTKERNDGLFDIVDSQGKVLNAKPLEKEVADNLILDFKR